MIQQDNPYFGIHFLGSTTNQFAATHGARPDRYVIGYYDTLEESVAARRAAIEQKREARDH